VRIRLLGPIEVIGDDGAALRLPPFQVRLLTRLALAPNRVVSVDRLADDLWQGVPPPSATAALRTHVSRLRKSLADEERIVTTGPGYLLRLGAAESDAATFADAAGRARRLAATGNHTGAAEAFAQALALWRGPALADVASEPWAIPEAGRLEEERLGAVEERVEAELASGRHAEITGELEALCADHPLRERLWAARMVALYRSGRQAEALRAFQQLRKYMAQELGIDPSPDLARLEAAVLAQDSSLDLAPSPPPPTAPSTAPPSMPSGVVTFLLTDVEGSTELWESDPSAMDRALARHDALVEQAVSDGGGLLLKSKGEGDATVSVFPRASSALATAVELQGALRSEGWPKSAVLRVRMALHTGEAHERDGDYFGPTLNRTARLRSLAAGGQILVSGATAELVIDMLPVGCTLADLGTMLLRGVRRPERVLLVTGPGLEGPQQETEVTGEGATTAVALAPALASTDRAPFVGRDTERTRLAELWRRATTGERQLVVVTGEPGIGKTRLAADVAVTAHRAGATVLYGHCDEEMGLPFQPFVEALGAYVASLSDVALRRHLAEHGPDLARLLPELSRRLGGSVELERAEPETERYLMFESVRAALHDAGAMSPVLLVIDDLHWARNPTMLLLRHVLRQHDERLMIVALSRDTGMGLDHPVRELLAELPSIPGAHRLALTGLDDRGVDAFVEVVSGRQLDAVEVHLARTLQEETGGNPLFLGELLRHLLDVGAIVRLGGHLRSATSATALALPESVRDLVTQRVRRLSEPGARLVETASVVGVRFTVDHVVDVLEPADDEVLVDAVEEVLRSGLVVERGEALAFSHALVRKAVYSSLSSARRSLLHQRVGEAIEARGDFEANFAALAHHYSESVGRVGVERATSWLLRSGHHQLMQLAFEEARATFERAVAILDAQGSSDHGRRADALLGLGYAQQAQGDVVGFKAMALRAAEEARLAGSADRLADAAVLRAAHESTGWRDPEAGALCREAIQALGPTDLARRARLLLSLGFVTLMDGEGQVAAALAQEAIDLAREHASTDVVARALYIKSVSMIGFASIEERLSIADELLAVATSANDLRHRGYGLLIRAPLRLTIGDTGGFFAALEEMEHLAAATRDWYLLANSAQLRATHALMQGRFDDAAVHLGEMLSHSSEQDFVSVFAGQTYMIYFWQGRLSELDDLSEVAAAQMPELVPTHRASSVVRSIVLGRVEDARQRFEKLAAGEFADIPRNTLWPVTVAQLAESSVLLGDTERAETLLQLLEDRSGQLVSIAAAAGFYASFDRILGMLWDLLGDQGRAAGCYDKALELEGRVGARPLMAQTMLCYSRSLAGHEPQRAAQLARECSTLAEELGMTQVAAEAQALVRQAGPTATGLPSRASISAARAGRPT
jgi:DNA-binding SARP family transcriptional activator/predicted ATPase/class 3 adenylate cyclase